MFKSIRKELQLMLMLLALIIALMLLNYYMNQKVDKWEQSYTKIIEISKTFAENVADEITAIDNSDTFHLLTNRYKTLQQTCLNCHDSRTDNIIDTRNTLLTRLHDNQFTGINHRKTVNDSLNKLMADICYTHDYHLASLTKNLSHSEAHKKSSLKESEVTAKTVTVGQELDLIKQTDEIQYTLSSIIRNFYVLKDTHTTTKLHLAFSKNITLFYTASEHFESSPLDPQDSLIAEDLLDFGRTIEVSFSKLVQLKETEKHLISRLSRNHKEVTAMISRVQDIIKTKMDRINFYLTIMEYTSFLFITCLILFITRQGKTIIHSINRLVTETEKIKQDYTYHIPEDIECEDEFKLLFKALNAMADDIHERIEKLNKETQLRTQAEKDKAATELTIQRAEQMAAIGTLAGGIAHDFNNLLTATLGNLNLATYFLSPEDKIYDSLRAAEKASKRAHKLTTQLLTFSKGGAPVKETAPINEIIQESASFILHGSNVKCSINIPDDLWLVTIDKGQIGQVIQNLVINADHAMPGGGTITISCCNYTEEKESSVLKKGQYVQVDVQDQGEGIKTEDRLKIFNPYFTTKATGPVKGSGLGLAIVHSIIVRHGGNITVESTVAVGTKFTFFLPAENDSQAPQQQIHEIIQPGDGKILLMDDEKMIVTMMQQALQSLGYTIETAENGEQALERFNKAAQNKAPFDLVIMDLTIPGGMGGQETAKQILSQYPSAKLIVSSGYADDPIMTNPSEYGFLGALKKPYELKKLSSIINQFMDT